MSESDENLMLGVRGGDVAKLGILFGRHHRSLLNFFFRMTGHKTVADDLAQEVFFRILKYRNTFRDDSCFMAWMFHIARNVRLDYLRKHRAETMLEENDANGIQNSSAPGQQLEHEQQAVLLERAMFKLSPEKREVLILHRYHGMKYEQIAELMGCEVGAVKTRAHRALKELRDIFRKLSREKTPCNVKKSERSLRIM